MQRRTRADPSLGQTRPPTTTTQAKDGQWRFRKELRWRVAGEAGGEHRKANPPVQCMPISPPRPSAQVLLLPPTPSYPGSRLHDGGPPSLGEAPLILPSLLLATLKPQCWGWRTWG